MEPKEERGEAGVPTPWTHTHTTNTKVHTTNKQTKHTRFFFLKSVKFTINRDHIFKDHHALLFCTSHLAFKIKFIYVLRHHSSFSPITLLKFCSHNVISFVVVGLPVMSNEGATIPINFRYSEHYPVLFCFEQEMLTVDILKFSQCCLRTRVRILIKIIFVNDFLTMISLVWFSSM